MAGLQAVQQAVAAEASGRVTMAGLWFEQLEPGLRVEHAIRRTVTEADNVLFTTMTMNPQPLHLDAEFAAGPSSGGRW